MNEAEYEKFAQEAFAYLQQQQDRNKAAFNLGSYEHYDWHQDTGQIVFSSGGVAKVVADIQFVGDISTKSKTWLWSWANASVDDPLKAGTRKVRAYGLRHGISHLVKAQWPAEEADGWAMTAIAARILKAKGAYRSPDENGYTFMLFTRIHWAPPGLIIDHSGDDTE